MHKRLLCVLGGIVLTAFALARPAHANAIFNINGDGINGQVTLTYQWDTIPGDPLNANNVLTATGYFSDSNVAGVTNWSITGLVPTNPNPGNAPFATSLSYFPATGLSPQDGGALSYDNLLYLDPSGAPDTCFDGITGGFLDVFGLMLVVKSPNGTQTGDLNLWSDGGGPNVSPIYGGALVNSSDAAVDYEYEGITLTPVPEPSGWVLFGTAMVGLVALRMRKAAVDLI